MARTAAEIASLLSDYRQEMRTEFARRLLLHKKVQGKLTSTWMPKNADAEYRDLFKKASGPWLEFTAACIAQGIRIDGCSDPDIWAIWQANGMDGRQNGVTNEAVRIGLSYVMVIPSATTEVVYDPETSEETGEVREVPHTGPDAKPVMRPLSALNTFAHYSDPWDETPAWALIRVGPVKVGPGDFWNSKWMFLDEQALYRYTGDGVNPNNMTVFEHGMVDEDGNAITPLAEVDNSISPFGRAPESSVERAIPVYQRIVDATFTLEMVQRYGAFPQKWLTGGTLGDGVNISADSMVSSPDYEAKFGNFQAAQLTEAAAAKDSHIKDLAAVCQVPPHYLLGAVVNMSAEGIAAAESGYFRNIGERQQSQGEGYELAARFVGSILGLDADALNAVEMHYEDVSSRSLAQIADAVVKLIGVDYPLQRAFALLPGVTQNDATDAAKKAAADAKAGQRQALAIAQATPPASTGDAPTSDPKLGTTPPATQPDAPTA